MRLLRRITACALAVFLAGPVLSATPGSEIIHDSEFLKLRTEHDREWATNWKGVFACRPLAGGLDSIPTDRVIDGIDQTALLLNGDGYSRRDYLHIYTGDILAASIKQQFKRTWIGDKPGLMSASYTDLYKDPREEQNGSVPLGMGRLRPYA